MPPCLTVMADRCAVPASGLVSVSRVVSRGSRTGADGALRPKNPDIPKCTAVTSVVRSATKPARSRS